MDLETSKIKNVTTKGIGNLGGLQSVGGKAFFVSD